MRGASSARHCKHLTRSLTSHTPCAAATRAGAYPTRSLRNLERLYGRLPYVNMAVRVPPAGVKARIRVLGFQGDSAADIVRADVATCGGGVIHILDDVVLPYQI